MTRDYWRAQLRRWGRECAVAVVDAICPPACPGCGVDGFGLCPACRAGLRRRPPPWCPRCGEPIGFAGSRCPGYHRAVRCFALVRAPFAYRGTAGDLVRRGKFLGDRAALAFLARHMAAAVAPWTEGPGRRGVVVPVPVHRRKRRQRPLDHAAVLAADIAQRTGLALRTGGLRRVRNTLPQGDIRVTNRTANVADAFAVRRPGAVADRAVLLVDDVRTSGSTTWECARVLRAAGVRRVALVTAAQA